VCLCLEMNVQVGQWQARPRKMVKKESKMLRCVCDFLVLRFLLFYPHKHLQYFCEQGRESPAEHIHLYFSLFRVTCG